MFDAPAPTFGGLTRFYHGFFLDFRWFLVGGDWNMTFIFPYIQNNHPIDFHIFQRGGSTTNQRWFDMGVSKH